MIDVPEAFAVATVAREGDAGRAWIDALPRVVRALCERWGLTPDGAAMHGYLGLVVPVQRGDEPGALKVSWLDDSSADEAAALAAWGGRGAVRLLDADMSFGAMLMERLDHRRSLSDVGVEEAADVAGRLLRRLAIPDPGGFRSLRDVAEQFVLDLPQRWDRHGRPMRRRVLDRARDLASELGRSAGNLLVNYDLHDADVLAGEREPWLVVDPKVVVGDPEFGLAQVLWRRLEDIEASGGLDRQFRLLTEAAELDPALARSWTLVRCVDYWLWGLGVGLTEDPARCETIVDWLA